MKELPQPAVAKVSGPAWELLRKQFLETGRLLLEVSPKANAELLSQYVKFTPTEAPNSPPYAVVWLKSSKRLIVGLALPEAYEAAELGPAPPKTAYKGLTEYFSVEPGGVLPRGLAAWARMAYQNVRSVAAQPPASTPTSSHGGHASRKAPVAGLPAGSEPKAA